MSNLSALNAQRIRPSIEPPLADVFREVLGPATASSTTPATGEKIYFGQVAENTTISELVALVEAQGTSITWDVGFELVDSVASGTVIAIDGKGNKLTSVSANYFFDDLAVAAAGRNVSAAWPITFKVPVKLVATQTGTTTGTPKSALIISGRYAGR